MSASSDSCHASFAVSLLALILMGFPGWTSAQTENAGPGGVDDEQKMTISVENGSLKAALNAFSQQAGMSLVIGPDVDAQINVRLKDVPWREALEVILQPYGFGYEIDGDTIIVNQLDKIHRAEQLISLETRVFRLQFLDASDLEDVVKSMLSLRGQLSVLRFRGQKGWIFESAIGGRSGRSTTGGVSSLGKLVRNEGNKKEDEFKSKTLVVTDTDGVLSRVAEVIERLDQPPIQILIEARFLEIGANRLRDIGVEFGTGAGGATSARVQSQSTRADGEVYGVGVQQNAGNVTPSAFNPGSGNVSPRAPFNAGLSLLWQQLSDVQYEVLLHMLEEDSTANLLSAPRVLTLNNQEATIIVGTKFPIITSEVSGEIASVSTTLEYYENIGIQLNVVPQVCADGNINLIVHPAVTDQIGSASARLGSGIDVPLTEYPILSTREAETQVMLKSGETLVMGGLLENKESVTELKTPLLGDLPLLGSLFKRTTHHKEKVDLLFFITATIMDTENSLMAELGRVGPTVREPTPAMQENRGPIVPRGERRPLVPPVKPGAVVPPGDAGDSSSVSHVLRQIPMLSGYAGDGYVDGWLRLAPHSNAYIP